jgi:uncharacterized membrane protein
MSGEELVAFSGGLAIHNLIKTGRILFAAAMAVFGVQCILFAAAAGARWPMIGAPWTQSHHVIAGIVGAGFLATAICIALPWQGGFAALVLAAGILLRALFLYVPVLLAQLHNPDPWTTTFELLAMGGAAIVLAATLADQSPGFLTRSDLLRRLSLVGQYLFAISLIVFGVQHLLYVGFVASLVPVWIPWHVFWAYATGIAFFVAAISLLTRQLIRPIAALLAAMFLLWVVVLHAPRVAAAPHSGDELTSAAVALAMGAAALIICCAAGAARLAASNTPA